MNLRQLLRSDTGDFILAHSTYKFPLRNINPIGNEKLIKYTMTFLDGTNHDDKRNQIKINASTNTNAYLDKSDRAVLPGKLDFVCRVQYYHVSEEELRKADEADAENLSRYYKKLTSP